MINKIVNPLDLPVGTDYKDEDTTIIVDSVTGELKQVLNKTIKDEGGASNLNDVLKGGNVATDTQATNGINLQDNGENVKINNTSFLIERPSKGFETSINNSSLNIKDQTSEINLNATGLSVTYNGVQELNVERSTIRINNGAESASLLPTGFDFSGTGNGSILFPSVESGNVKTFALQEDIIKKGSWAPVLGGITSSSLQEATYNINGKLCSFYLRFTSLYGSLFSISLPFPLDNNYKTGVYQIKQISGQTSSIDLKDLTINESLSGSYLITKTLDGGDATLTFNGVNSSIRISGCYTIA